MERFTVSCILLDARPSAFDYASLSESFVNNSRGGGIAYIGNSSYGWGAPGNPGFGYSDRFDSRFFFELFNDSLNRAGEALAIAKSYYIPFSREQNVYRWHQYQLNLLGDPEMPLWTDEPRNPTVHFPSWIPVGYSRITVTVSDRGRPIPKALVCLQKIGMSYSRGKTDATGQVSLPVNMTDIDSLELTVTANNFLPFETKIGTTTGSFVNFLGLKINDSLGNQDGIANPNETVLLPIVLKNSGNQMATNVEMRLRSTDSLVYIVDSTEALSSINAGDSVNIADAFRIYIGNASNGHCLYFVLEIRDTSKTLSFKPSIMVGTPKINNSNFVIYDPPALPGDTESLSVYLRNLGFGIGHNTWARLSSNDPYVSVISDSAYFGTILPDSVRPGDHPYRIAISPLVAPSYLARLELRTYCPENSFLDTIPILIGRTGFLDNMEAGTGQWTTGGTNNLWHISSRRYHSFNHAWYCGDENTGQYLEAMNCWIQTIPFMLDRQSLFKFWRWFYVPIYGVDGIYVIVQKRNGSADTLDFIGTGGALRQKAIVSNWFEESYDLTRFPIGDTIQIRFSFYSDQDGKIGEGFYIDDVRISPITECAEASSLLLSEQLYFRVMPNPFRGRIVFKFHTPQPGKTNIVIYNILGQKLVDIFNGALPSGEYQFTWDGKDENRDQLPAGIYFSELKVEGYTPITKKLVITH